MTDAERTAQLEMLRERLLIQEFCLKAIAESRITSIEVARERAKTALDRSYQLIADYLKHNIPKPHAIENPEIQRSSRAWGDAPPEA